MCAPFRVFPAVVSWDEINQGLVPVQERQEHAQTMHHGQIMCMMGIDITFKHEQKTYLDHAVSVAR